MHRLTWRERADAIGPVRAALRKVLPILAKYVYVRYIAGVADTRTPDSWNTGIEHYKVTFEQTGLGATGKPKSRTPLPLTCVRNRVIGRNGYLKGWETRYLDADGDEAKLLVLSSMLHEQIYLLVYGEKATESSEGKPGMFSEWRVPKATTVIPSIGEDVDDVICRWLMVVAAWAILEYTKPDENSWADKPDGAGTVQRLQMIIKEKYPARAWEMQLVVGTPRQPQGKKGRKARAPGKTPGTTPVEAEPAAAAAEAPDQDSDATISQTITQRRGPQNTTDPHNGAVIGPGRSSSPGKSQYADHSRRSNSQSPLGGRPTEVDFGVDWTADVMCGLAFSCPLTRRNTEDAFANVLWNCEDSE